MSAPTTARPSAGPARACESCRVRPAVTTVTVGDAAPFAVCGDCIPRPGDGPAVQAAPGVVAGSVDEVDAAAVEAAVVMAGGRVRRQYQAADGWHVVEAFAPVMSWLVPVTTIVVVPVGALWAWFSTGSPFALMGTAVGLAVALCALDGAVSR